MNETSSSDVVLFNVDTRGVATVTLNRPTVNNAYNGDVIEALLSGIERCRDDGDIRVVVIRGNGPHFQAGADLKWIAAIGKLGEEENIAASRKTATAVRNLDELPKPVVALVHGGCFGGGVGIVAACDVVIADTNAVFAITEARWGLTAGIIIAQLINAIGPRQTRRYAQTCERFDAKRARDLGLVHEVCDGETLDQTAAPIIDQLLKSAPDALADTKSATAAISNRLPGQRDFELLIRAHALKRRTSEAVEGTASFIEKRDPDWYRP